MAPIREKEADRKGGDAVVLEWKYLERRHRLPAHATWALYDSKWDWKTRRNPRLDEIGQKNCSTLVGMTRTPLTAKLCRTGLWPRYRLGCMD